MGVGCCHRIGECNPAVGNSLRMKHNLGFEAGVAAEGVTSDLKWKLSQDMLKRPRHGMLTGDIATFPSKYGGLMRCENVPCLACSAPLTCHTVIPRSQESRRVPAQNPLSTRRRETTSTLYRCEEICPRRRRHAGSYHRVTYTSAY